MTRRPSGLKCAEATEAACPLEHDDHLTRLEIPDARRAVSRSCHDLPAVGAEGGVVQFGLTLKPDELISALTSRRAPCRRRTP